MPLQNAKSKVSSHVSTQASITAGRQSSSQNGTTAQQTGSTQATVSTIFSLKSQETLQFDLLSVTF